jgi:uncharacterized membrane protein YjfL (UPF0719 family)
MKEIEKVLSFNDLSQYWSLLFWSTLATVGLIIVFLIIKNIIRSYIKKKERIRNDKHIEELFVKYSDILVDKIYNKINNKSDN